MLMMCCMGLDPNPFGHEPICMGDTNPFAWGVHMHLSSQYSQGTGLCGPQGTGLGVFLPVHFAKEKGESSWNSTLAASPPAKATSTSPA